MSNVGIKWLFIVGMAPWMGGFYERLVGLVKRAMRSEGDEADELNEGDEVDEFGNSDSEDDIIIIDSDDEYAIIPSNMHQRIQTFV